VGSLLQVPDATSNGRSFIMCDMVRFTHRTSLATAARKVAQMRIPDASLFVPAATISVIVRNSILLGFHGGPAAR